MISRRSLLAALAALPFIPKAKAGPAAVVEETIAVGPLSKTTRTEFDHAADALGYARMGYGSTDGVRVAAHPCAVSKVWADGAVASFEPVDRAWGAQVEQLVGDPRCLL